MKKMGAIPEKKGRIAYIHPFPSTFVMKDMATLAKKFRVKEVYYRGPLSVLKILMGVIGSDLAFSRFADIHALFMVFFARIFRKRSMVVVGGYEVARLPELDYGLTLSPILSRVVSYVLRKTDRVLTVSENLKEDAVQNVGVSGEKIRVIPNGWDAEKFKPAGVKEDLVLTVSLCRDWKRARLKGLDIFIDTAKYLPGTRFVVIGITGSVLEKFKAVSASNVELLPYLTQDEVISYCQRAKVYCQLSLREGHPNALSEAMLCGCVPVGTDIPSVRMVIGETGFLVPVQDSRETAAAIKKALVSDKGEAARERIKSQFSLEKREKSLFKEIESIGVR